MSLSEEKVLRVNCPGFGVSSTLLLGEAKPLAMYDVIIVNPSSVLHLFDNKSDIIKQIEVLQSDGMTSYRADSDALLENIAGEVDCRSQEMQAFIKKGGLLIFLLVPPFTVSGPGQSMDNYTWLNEWCPDKPTGANSRNMSATIRGKAIETSADAAQSVWAPYLKQANLEWSTIIRLENLTEGFVPLATAGPNKCIAGFKATGHKGGQVVFLPAPYTEAFDEKLHECIDRWFAMHSDGAAAPTGLQSLSKGLSSLLSDEPAEEAPATAAKSVEPPVVPPPPPPPPPPVKVQAPVEPVAPVQEEPVVAPQPEEPVMAAVHEEVSHNNQAETLESPPETAPQFFDNPPAESLPETAPEAGALINRMREGINRPVVPEWCSAYSFDELDGLRQELTDLNEEIRLSQLRAQELAERILIMDDLKNALLSSEGEHLVDACSRVFECLGWQVKPAMGPGNEIWLVDEDKTQAIVRLIYSHNQPNRAELASLAESVITYWGAHEIEPKGILVASTWADTPPSDRPEEDFPESMNEFAKRKNLCLLTTAQLLSIFRDLDVAELDPQEIRENILTTSGHVKDYVFETKGAETATVRK